MSAPKTDRTAKLRSPGDLIANTYRIEQEISRGGMGAVYRCMHEVMGETVAVKVILDEFINDQRAVALFQREAAALKAVRHPAVIGYEATLRDAEGDLFLVMEYVEGKSLRQILQEGGRLPPAGVVALGRRLAEGLHAAHSVGVAHRDMSPDNIILPGDNDVTNAKILDFGIAKDLKAPDKSIFNGSFAGRVSYASPEQLGLFGRDVTERTDVYSLGLVLAEVAGINLDVMTRDMAEAVDRRAHNPAIPASTDSDIAQRLRAMLVADPAKRPVNIIDAWDGAAAPPQPTPALKPQRKPKQAAYVGDTGETIGSDENIDEPSPDPFTSGEAGGPGSEISNDAPVREKGGKTALFAGFLITVALIALIGGGGYFVWNKTNSPTVELPTDVEETKKIIETASDPYAKAVSLMSSREKDDQNTALRTFQTLFAQGDGRSARQIGRMYDPKYYTEVGSPVSEANLGNARRWYKRAAALGDQEAIDRLGELE